MAEPKLTIGIPTQGKRPERLEKAIGSALAQKSPAVVLIADQGGGAAEVVRPYLDNPLVRHVVTDATSLWGNWTAAAEAAETPYFAWLQDDDVVAPHYASRIVSCLERYPQAACYVGYLAISRSPGLGNRWEFCGPILPGELMHGTPTLIDGALLILGAYFTSHALSPGVAFPVNAKTLQAVRNVPDNADLFAERSILAELGRLGQCVVDPATVGYWVQHEGNESRVQNAAGDAPRQLAVMCKHVDPLMEEIPHWRNVLRGWLMMSGESCVKHYHDATRGHDGKSPVLAEMREIVRAMYPAIKEVAAEPEKAEVTA